MFDTRRRNIRSSRARADEVQRRLADNRDRFSHRYALTERQHSAWPEATHCSSGDVCGAKSGVRAQQPREEGLDG
jgi:hypothetical protein